MNDEEKLGVDEGIHERLKILRKTMKLTQLQFGDKLGVTKSVIYNYEGRTMPRDPFVRLVSRTFGVNMDWLVNGSGNMMDGVEEKLFKEFLMVVHNKDGNPQISRIISSATRLKKEHLDIVEGLVKHLEKCEIN